MSKSVTLTPLQSTELNQTPVPERVLVVPWGRVESSNGMFVVDDESARLAIATFTEHGTDLPVDYEHQTLGGVYASPSGQAPAAGWITRLEADPGAGLFARVQWTEPAREQIAARQYRYLSPVAVIRSHDRKLTALHSVALTNKPAIVGAAAIVNRAVPVSESPDTAIGEPMTVLHHDDLSRPRMDETPEVGGLSRSAAEMQLLTNMKAAVDRLPVEDFEEPLDDFSVGAVEDLQMAATRQLDDGMRRMWQIREELRRQDEDALVMKARRSGRLMAGQESWARRLIAHDRGLFEEWLRTTPMLVSPGRMVEGRESRLASSERGRVIAQRARHEYRTHPEVAGLTTEDAYVALALRDAGCLSDRPDGWPPRRNTTPHQAPVRD